MADTLTINEAMERLEQVARRTGAEEKAAHALSGAKTRLVLARDATSTFFASLVMRLKASPCWGIDTAATDGVRLLYNPDFVNGLPEKELTGVLAHEVMHCANKHFSRRNGRDANLFNIACDLAINQLLLDAGFKLPKEGCFPGKKPYENLAANMSAEEYYNLLPKGAKREGGDNQDPGGCGGVIDPVDGDGQPMSTPAQNALEQDWNANVAGAHQAAKSRGQLPGSIDRLVGELLEPVHDWRAELRQFMTSKAKRDYSWSRPNRRYLCRNLYLPSITGTELGHVAVFIDTSGSISPETITRFASEINDIASLGACKLSVGYHHAECYRIDEFNPGEEQFIVGQCLSGGTDHRPCFSAIDRMEEPPAIAIFLTDMCSAFPTHAPDYPVLFASTEKHATKPFGEMIFIPAE